MIAAASLSRAAAWNSPSAWMTLARRSRSASACLAMARFISSGRSTSFISTSATLMPQGSVASSRMVCILTLSLSRSASSSSSSAWPTTLRSVVCASWLVANRKFSTSMIDLLRLHHPEVERPRSPAPTRCRG